MIERLGNKGSKISKTNFKFENKYCNINIDTCTIKKLSLQFRCFLMCHQDLTKNPVQVIVIGS
jgi:hypothetical protein